MYYNKPDSGDAEELPLDRLNHVVIIINACQEDSRERNRIQEYRANKQRNLNGSRWRNGQLTSIKAIS